jgi:hypothetical protein
MNIAVERKDINGNITNENHTISRLQLIKHLAMAGQGYMPKPQKILRTMGLFLYYSYYLRRSALNDDRFSEPPSKLSDPTEKGDFTTVVGKAIADFLSKRIDNSLFTVNYEAAMRIRGLPIKNKRPDLLAFSPNAMFALEAKGRKASTPGNMNDHKKQAQSGSIGVNFTVACISYNIFKKIKCKYYDPFNDNVEYDNTLLSKLSADYYRGLSEFLDKDYFRVNEVVYNEEKFYEIEIFYRNYEKFMPRPYKYDPFIFFDLLDIYHPRLILPRNINELAVSGITNNATPFKFETDPQQGLYIDNDRVGLRFDRLI